MSKINKPRNNNVPIPFWERNKWKLVGAAIILLISTQIPLLGYLERVTLSVLTFGVSKATVESIEVHTDWFKRYFTGPLSDEAMISRFRSHRTDLERMAYIFALQGDCGRRQQEKECSGIEQRVGMRVGMEGRMVGNSALRQPGSRTCHFPCMVQTFRIVLQEPQQWWRTKNSKIEAWEKVLIYVPPLLPDTNLGLDEKGYPTDTVEVMRRICFGNIVDTLDVIPSGLDRDPGNWGYPNCAARHVDGQWFIKLRPIVSQY